MNRLIFSLVSAATEIKPHHLAQATRALEHNAGDCALAWGMYPPAVVVGTLEHLPDFCCPIVVMDESTDPETLAYHTYDPARLLPAGRAFVGPSSGFNTGSYSLVEAIAHEICEALVDPLCDLWSPLPFNAFEADTMVAREVGDPVQTSYEIPIDGVAYQVANFVTPAWFDRRLEDEEIRKRFISAGGRFDHNAELTRPGQVGPEGYLILQNSERGTWYESTAPIAAERVRAKVHPWSRTKRRGVRMLPGVP